MYDDNQIPTAEILAKMREAYQIESVQVEVCEVSEYRQIAEIEEILALLHCCEGFLKWLEGKDNNFDTIKELIRQTENDKVMALGCCGKRGLDYRYGCCESPKNKDFNQNCNNYCKCEMEIIDKVIKLLTLRNSIIDKECMIRLAKNRMDMLKMIFNKYSK